MKNPTSFISEHTAEFALVPALKLILQKKFKYVTPIYPWITREGSNISTIIHKNDTFRIVGLYPRRPKINLEEKDTISIKINSEIISSAKFGKTNGLPIIAGCPLSKNFWDLGQIPDCLWVKLDFAESITKEFKIDSISNYHVNSELFNMTFQNENSVIDYIIKNTKIFNIYTAIETFRSIKSAGNENSISAHSFNFMWGYKPVYFLLNELLY